MSDREELADLIDAALFAAKFSNEDYATANVILESSWLAQVKVEAGIAVLRTMAEDVTNECSYTTAEYGTPAGRGACDDCKQISEFLDRRADDFEREPSHE